MAGIDKTYLNWEEYLTLRKWLTKDVKKQIRKEIGFSFDCYRSYRKKDFGEGGLKELPIWNTPSLFDIWLAKNCKLEFIQDRLQEQYSSNWIGWLDNDFDSLGFIASIARKSKEQHTLVYTFSELDKGHINLYEELVVFGTDYFKKVWYSALSIVRGETYNSLFKDLDSLTIKFKFLGNLYKAESSKRGVEYYLIDSDEDVEGIKVDFGYFPKDWFQKSDYFKKIFFHPKITYPNKEKDFLKYEPDQIIMSRESECYSATSFNDFKKENYKRYFLFLPKYSRIF